MFNTVDIDRQAGASTSQIKCATQTANCADDVTSST